ncbi:MAG: cytochrome C oxidase subunit IV family protein [Bacteroidetes bacterium]|nr:cytochrome C oxidase subunit IV family protein [Bacteroidota bacterium]MDA0972764.1 cytochrome C oxidase subunit IV family protein [Bacteroidota bacterium]
MDRDDLIVNESYAVNNRHDDAHGKEIRKKILKVTVLLSVITAIEVAIGANMPRESGQLKWEIVKYLFIILTLVKAAYIVLSFMHLGDERKNLRNVVLIPYAVFILYLIFIAIIESNYVLDMFQAG